MRLLNLNNVKSAWLPNSLKYSNGLILDTLFASGLYFNYSSLEIDLSGFQNK